MSYKLRIMKINYNSNTINNWYFEEDNIIKVYRNNAVCYYKISGGGDTPTAQTPCFAVVDNISQYQETEFEDVYDKTTSKWYKLNNLNQYERYGVYGSSTGVSETYYDGKLTIDNGYEYQYSGNSWVNVGEVSGSSRVPYDYTEVEYIENTSRSYINTEFKPNQDTRIVCDMQTVTSSSYGRICGAGGYNTANGMQFDYEPNSQGSLNISWGTINNWTTYSNCTGDYNRHVYDWDKNYFYRDKGETNQFSASTTYGNFQCTDNLVIFTFNHNGSPSTQYTTEYLFGKMYSFQIYDNGTLVRDLIPCKRNSDSLYGAYDIVNDVFYYTPNYSSYPMTGGDVIHRGDFPIYYQEKSEPLDNISFSSMTEAEEYECPWWGMTSIINNEYYLFCETNTWLTKYEYEEVSGDYLCDNGNKYKKMQEYDRNIDGTFSPTTHYVKGDLIESGSTDCAKFNGKWIGYYSDSTSYLVVCDSTSAITKSEVRQGNYTAYTKVIIGDCVSRVGEAFQQCTSMRELEIGSGVTSDMYYAFEDCQSLTSVTWYATNLSNTQDGAFNRCYSLQKLVMYSTSCPSVSATMFNGVPRTMVVYVPDEAISNYESKNYWRNFTIKGHSELP